VHKIERGRQPKKKSMCIKKQTTMHVCKTTMRGPKKTKKVAGGEHQGSRSRALRWNAKAERLHRARG
jgi:hypothetical protein